MKNKFYLNNFKTQWIKYDDYQIKIDNNGNEYIVPNKDSNYTIYNPFEVSDKLLFDLIDLGDAALKKDADKDIIKKKILLFARNYGLLGLISSSVYNRNIIGEEKVLFTENNIITKEKLMDTSDYMSLFTPFSLEGDIYTRTFDDHLTVFKAEDSPKFYGKRPLILDVVFSKFYAEQLNWIIEFAKNMSTHLNQLIIYKNISLTEPVTIMAGEFKAQKIGFTISMFDKPEINWEFDSLESTIETIYAFALTDESFILTRCEYCKEAFIAKSEREKYCSPSCRNCINVIKSRNKKKLIKDLNENETAEKNKLTKNDIGEVKGVKNMEIDEKKKEAIYEYRERKTTGGVYKITNTANSRSLIRCEIDLKSMKNRFNFSVSTGSCVNIKIQKDWKTFGAKAFEFEILEEIEMENDMSIIDFKKQLKVLEEKYISEANKENLY
jgi:hypothetical protein